MEKLILIILAVLISSCSAMKSNQLRYICNQKAAHSEGRVAAALQEPKSYQRYERCDPLYQKSLVQAYNDGFNYYQVYEDNKVGEVDGVAGFGAGIKYACVGTLFHQNYIGKGSNQGKAMNHLMAVCRSSDNSVHCKSMYSRCRRINFGNVID